MENRTPLGHLAALLTGLGTALTLAGLILSEYKPKKEN